MARYTVVVTDGGSASYAREEAVLAEVGAEVVLRGSRPLETACAGAHGLLVRQSPIDRALIGRMPSCRAIARYGIGVDNVDLAAATDAGIVVANTPGFCTEDVATHALALLLSAIRRIPLHDRKVREGAWDLGGEHPIHRERGRTLGLVGFGAIPQVLAEKASGLGLRLLAFDPYVPPETAEKYNVTLVSLEALCREADYISMHAPLNDETRHMLSKAQFDAMKDGVILVNTSRGPTIDEAALAEALETGKVATAALDVFEVEPLPADSPIRRIENVILSDHAGWYSEESLAELQTRAAKGVADVLAGRRPESVVNPEVYERGLRK